jgi:hypothetical protein
MTRRVDRERSILGTELEEPKIGRSGRGGDGECIENVTHGLPWRLKETLHPWRLGPKKRLKRPDALVGVRWKGRRKRRLWEPFSATFSQIHRYMGVLLLGKRGRERKARVASSASDVP